MRTLEEITKQVIFWFPYIFSFLITRLLNSDTAVWNFLSDLRGLDPNHMIYMSFLMIYVVVMDRSE